MFTSTELLTVTFNCQAISRFPHAHHWLTVGSGVTQDQLILQFFVADQELTLLRVVLQLQNRLTMDMLLNH